MRGTIPMQARKGRASYLGARSVGHQDPGATSTWLIFRSLAEAAAAASRDPVSDMSGRRVFAAGPAAGGGDRAGDRRDWTVAAQPAPGDG